MSDERNHAADSGEEQILEDEAQAYDDDAGLTDADVESESREDGQVDEGGGDADAAGDERQQEAPVERRPRNLSRGSARFQQLNNENREIRRELEELKRAQQQAQQPRGPTPEQIAAQERQEEQALINEVQMLDPVQASVRLNQFYTMRSERRTAAAIQNIQYTTWDATDRSNYERELAANPRFSRFDARVEELRRQAPGVSRMDLLDKAIGEATRRNLGASTTRARNQAAASSTANASRPSRSAGNVPSERGTGTRRRGWEHMRDVQI